MHCQQREFCRPHKLLKKGENWILGKLVILDENVLYDIFMNIISTTPVQYNPIASLTNWSFNFSPNLDFLIRTCPFHIKMTDYTTIENFSRVSAKLLIKSNCFLLLCYCLVKKLCRFQELVSESNWNFEIIGIASDLGKTEQLWLVFRTKFS